jgi:hypothetical protein|tara:strand:- start:6 stop:632 length:627 start_codon:yes stop_codon:yes gene_type:complete
MAVVSNGTTIIDAGALGASAGAGKLTLIKTLTASSSSTLSFVHGASSVVFDGTYDSYVFKFINMHPASSNQIFQFQTSTDGGSSYGVTYTNTVFLAYHKEDGSSTGLNNEAGRDQAQSTAFANLCGEVARSGEADQACSGFLTLYNPSSATFVKHCISTFIKDAGSAEIFNQYQAGYMNTTTALNAIQFKFASGNIDSGTIKLYGIGG